MSVDPIAGQPTVDDVKEWLRLDDTIDDGALQRAVDGVAARHRQRLNFPVDDAVGVPFYDDDLIQAFLIRCSRLLDRRNSPGGIQGFDGYGAVAVARTDPDAADLETPYLKILVG